MNNESKNERGEFRLRGILVPIDFSSVSRKALMYAVPFAVHFDAKITLLHVIEPPPYDPALGPVPLVHDIPLDPCKGELDRIALSEVGEKFLEDAIIRRGCAYDGIVETARERQTDLIVLTTHGYTGLKHAFVGSTAERVVRYAPCPVLVVREIEHEFV